MKKNYSIAILFIAYFAVLMKLIVFKYPAQMVISDGNYIPFKTILHLNAYPTWIVAKNNLIGNIALFVPLGFFIPFLYGRPLTWRYVLVTAFILSVTLESTQVLLRAGVFDVDDIILNVFGAIAGYGVFVLAVLIFRTARKRLVKHRTLFKK